MRSLVPIFILLALVGPVEAHHCENWSTARPEVDTGILYVDGDCWEPWCPHDVIAIWIYEESNGIPGLQRGDDWRDDTCHGMIMPDTLIF